MHFKICLTDVRNFYSDRHLCFFSNVFFVQDTCCLSNDASLWIHEWLTNAIDHLIRGSSFYGFYIFFFLWYMYMENVACPLDNDILFFHNIFIVLVFDVFFISLQHLNYSRYLKCLSYFILLMHFINNVIFSFVNIFVIIIFGVFYSFNIF